MTYFRVGFVKGNVDFSSFLSIPGQDEDILNLRSVRLKGSTLFTLAGLFVRLSVVNMSEVALLFSNSGPRFYLMGSIVVAPVRLSPSS